MRLPSMDPVINTALWVPRQVQGALTAGSVANARDALEESRRRLEVRDALDTSSPGIGTGLHPRRRHGAA